MQPKKVRVPTTEQAKRHASARETIQSELPPKRRSIATPSKGSIADPLRNAREAQAGFSRTANCDKLGELRRLKTGRNLWFPALSLCFRFFASGFQRRSFIG